MSQMPATTALRAPQRAVRVAPRPELRVVSTGSTRVAAPPRRLPFVLFCSALLTIGLMTLLFINMSLAKGAYALHDLRTRSVALSEDTQELREQLATAQAPANLARAAREIGMVPGTAPVFLDVHDGAVTGIPTPAPTPTKTPGAAASEAPSSSGASQATAGRSGNDPTGTPSSPAPSGTSDSGIRGN